MGHPVPAPCVVRPVRAEDEEDLVANYFGCYDERERGEPIGIVLFAERPSRTAEADWFAGLLGRVGEGGELAFVAEVDGRAAGLCTVSPLGPPGHEAGHVGALGILIGAAARGRGVGGALLRSTRRACEGRFEIIVLSVFRTNEAARRLYEKVGFRTYGTLPRAIRRGGAYLDEEKMYLVLPPGRGPKTSTEAP